MFYRTRTYIAADWDHDRDVVDKLLEWNQSSNCSLEFSYAHDLMQARDESLYCSIKKSLRERLNGSKTFVLIAGAETTRVTKGGCQYCQSYNSCARYCVKGMYVDYRSYIEYECELATKIWEEGKMDIVVIYKGIHTHNDWIFEILSGKGIHIPAYYLDSFGNKFWNKQKIVDTLMN